jgi:hypothetical protein
MGDGRKITRSVGGYGNTIYDASFTLSVTLYFDATRDRFSYNEVFSR